MQAGTILHADLDAFYASVEQLLDSSLRGQPIAVGGGVVLAASYEAKAFGVRGGMTGRRARELCPQLRFVSGNFEEYQRLGDAAIKILGDFTPLVERLSIDEAFADVAGCERLFGPPAEIATSIRRRVREELGLPISVGVARTKHLATIASQVSASKVTLPTRRPLISSEPSKYRSNTSLPPRATKTVCTLALEATSRSAILHSASRSTSLSSLTEATGQPSSRATGTPQQSGGSA